jgi:hypothetical protein
MNINEKKYGLPNVTRKEVSRPLKALDVVDTP